MKDHDWLMLGLKNIIRRYDERPRRYSLESLLEDVRWMIREAERKKSAASD
jgi:hypothetical protein